MPGVPVGPDRDSELEDVLIILGLSLLLSVWCHTWEDPPPPPNPDPDPPADQVEL